MTLTVGSLFSGIGGLELGLERAGMRTVWQVEKDEYCRRVLAKHWPDVERFNDVREVGAHNLPPVDLICGGFPCQDISIAGRKAGILPHTRSGLWYEYARIIRELRPRYVLVENVAALLTLGLDIVLGELAEVGYDAEWYCVPAAAVGALHRRDRIFVLAYPASLGLGRRAAEAGRETRQAVEGLRRSEPDATLADATQLGRGPGRTRRFDTSGARESEQPLSALAHAISPRLQGREWLRSGVGENRSRRTRPYGAASQRGADGRGSSNPWSVEPNVGRVANGVPSRVDRLRGLGNAVVPQVAEFIGRLIVEADEAAMAA